MYRGWGIVINNTPWKTISTNCKIPISNKVLLAFFKRKILALMFILLLAKAENTAKPTYSQHSLIIDVAQM